MSAAVSPYAGAPSSAFSHSTPDLDASGHVAVSPLPGDARNLPLALTPKGRRLLKKMMPLALRRQHYRIGLKNSGWSTPFFVVPQAVGVQMGWFRQQDGR